MSVDVTKIKNCYDCLYAKEKEAEHRCSYYGLGIDKPFPGMKKLPGCKVTELITVETE